MTHDFYAYMVVLRTQEADMTTNINPIETRTQTKPDTT